MKHFLHKTIQMFLLCLLAGNAGAQSLIELKKQAEKGDSISMLKLGMSYINGSDSLKKNEVKGFALIKQSAEKGYPDAQYCLAIYYRQGMGTMPNTDESMKWLKKSAENENIEAINDLGCNYMNGRVIKQNPKEAFRLFEKGVRKGNLKSQLYLGEMLLWGENVEKDYQRAFMLFAESARQGQALSMHHLGQMYKNGTGLKKDYKEAVNWFKQSATIGNDEGMFMLAYMYFKGFGIEQDYKKAVYWAQKSAKFHNNNGAFLLGYCYKEGYGVPVDTLFARKWLSRADTSKNYQAKTALEDLEKPQKGQSKLKSAALPDSLTPYIPKTFSHTKSATSDLKIDGYWEGKALVYDWSGTRIIEEYPVKVETRNNEGKIIATWTISDSIKIMGSGVMTKNMIDFNEMNFVKSDWYSKGLSKWKITHGEFELKGSEKNILAGNLSLYSIGLEEEGNPTYVVLKRAKQPTENVKNTFFDINSNLSLSVVVYPNPFTNWVNINYKVPATGSVLIELLDISGTPVVIISKKDLVPGIYTETYINSDLTSKAYILRITQNNKAITQTIIKQ